MKTYGKIICPDCGETITKMSPNTKRCKPCALKAHGQTENGFKKKICLMCSIEFKPTGSVQVVCDGCAGEFRKMRRKESTRAVQLKANTPYKGAVLNCEDCGSLFTYIAGPQRKCDSCCHNAVATANKIWRDANKDKIAKYALKAASNYYFGGNRIKALERDEYTCQHCRTHDDLHVHHIDGKGSSVPREERNHALGNLQTLCRGCHTKLHHKLRHSS